MAASDDIPIIDLSGDQDDVARQLVDAAEEHGFIYIRNQGLDIPVALIDGAFRISKKLFDAPLEEKQAHSLQADKRRGWVSMQSESLDPRNQKTGDYKEVFNFAEFINGIPQQPIPPTIVPDQPDIDALAIACRALCRKILHLLGIGLQVGDFFTSAHNTQASDDSGVTLRFLKYPPIDPASRSGNDMRAGAHSDYGSITLLFRLRGQAGLELQRKNGEWAPVPVCPPGSETDAGPPILVNVGDILSYWTNGLFRSTLHRVVFPSNDDDDPNAHGEPRYSIAYFCHPMGDVCLEPVPSDRVRNYVPSQSMPNTNPYAQRKVLTPREHLRMRLEETHGMLLDDDEKNS